jgi:hypothetical protein
MALSDLSPEELQLVQNTLLAPPPSQFAPQPQQQMLVDDQLRAMAESGFLGEEGRFFSAMAQQQDRQKRLQMAKEASRLTGLEPDFYERVQGFAQVDPEAFASSPVQQALSVAQSINERARKKAEEAQAAQVFGQVRKMTPQQIEELQTRGDPTLFKFRDVAEQVSKAKTEASDLLSQIPQKLQTNLQGASLPQVKTAYEKYNRSIPPVLRKKPFEDQQTVADLAKRWKAAFKAEEKAIKAGTMPTPKPGESLPSETLKRQIVGILSPLNPDKEFSDEIIDSIAKSSALILDEEDPQEILKKRMQEVEGSR